MGIYFGFVGMKLGLEQRSDEPDRVCRMLRERAQRATLARAVRRVRCARGWTQRALAPAVTRLLERQSLTELERAERVLAALLR
jgi:hypothetical protein